MHRFEHGEYGKYDEPDEHVQPPDDDAIEVVDLELPEDGSAFWSASRFLTWQRTWNRRRFRIMTISGLFALLAVVCLLSVPVITPLLTSMRDELSPSSQLQADRLNSTVSAPVQINPSLELLPQYDSIACLLDSAWSPDSAYVAFIGYQLDCVYGNHVYERGLLAVYSVITGKPVRLLSPDNAIFQTLHKQFPTDHDALNIYYGSVLWSPDQRRIALTFTLGSPTGASQSDGIVGLALVDNSTGHVQVMLSAQHQGSNAPLEWDMQKQRVVSQSPVPSPIPASTIGLPSFPTFAYRWGAGGKLLPVIIHGRLIHIPKSKVGQGQVGQIGNPDGEQSFTIWQPGVGMLNTLNSNESNGTPGIFTWSTYFSAWSPDQRYLISSFSLEGVLQVPGQPVPASRTLRQYHLNNAPAIPVRDTALQHLLFTLNTSSFNVVVSWHPAGFLLAAYDYGTIDLDVYDCVTGNQVASLLLPDVFRTDLSGSTLLRWSPDGSRLLLFDPQLSVVTVWQVHNVV